MHPGGKRTRYARPYGQKNHRAPARVRTRPYEETASGSVGADCISARAPVSEAPSPNTPAVGARMARPEPSAVFARPSVDAPGMAACGHAALRPQRSVKCFASGWQADALCAPLRPKEPSCPGASQDPPLRGNRKRIRRGGLYIRPDRTAASDAPAPPALHTEPDLPAACISTSILAL